VLRFKIGKCETLFKTGSSGSHMVAGGHCNVHESFNSISWNSITFLFLIRYAFIRFIFYQFAIDNFNIILIFVFSRFKSGNYGNRSRQHKKTAFQISINTKNLKQAPKLFLNVFFISACLSCLVYLNIYNVGN
jgi:hypothetical protein